MTRKLSAITIFALMAGFYIVGFYLVHKYKQETPQVLPSQEVALETTQSSPSLTNMTFYLVDRVIDGDTVDVQVGEKIERIRLIGVDAPESVDPRNPIECFGNEASAKLKEMLEGKLVALEEDPSQQERDRYNRLLRYIFLEDGTFVNEEIIKQGFAFEYTYRTPYLYQQRFKEAQSLAEINKAGLWADGACN